MSSAGEAMPDSALPIGAVRLREATPADVTVIYEFICALADYERLRDHVTATPAQLHVQLFGADPAAFVLIAELLPPGGAPIAVGFALYFRSFSTFLARPGLYLEDLFVVPAARGRGIGLALMRRLARIALTRGWARFEWSVLDWNTPAIDFYRRLGAVPQAEWTVQRLVGAPLAALAAADSMP